MPDKRPTPNCLFNDSGNIKEPIIVWAEKSEAQRALILKSIEHAISPVSGAFPFLTWDGEDLVLAPPCASASYTALYFWLSGWGDSGFARGER